MNSWFFLFFLLVLVLGVTVYMATDKVRKDIYNPYFLKPLMAFYAVFGVLFFVAAFWFLFQL